ncbi:hypothetical protein BDB00DRAFT_875650 [Zychaea mexicana]|uniref:uncharacterized protein n=1 Tax=Zychaea mexicana TaxID=64656 RepID=UPI0022FF191F|nr:uncharacterized protein BDB00DRAFT_875650 [Zychaea mexicana]KAI9490065.1 hypothetical protein BDB00DRAFT_875650 [Zychaea mexicana]
MTTSSESRLSSSSTSISSSSSRQQQQQRNSWRQNSPSSEPSASPPFSIDQLSIFARRASSSSITISALTQSFQNQRVPDEQERKQRMHDAAHQVTTGVVTTTQLALNDCSVGLYRVFDHIQRKIPQIVDEKKCLRVTREQVDTATEDIVDVRKVVAEVERIESFNNISDMIKSSLTIVKVAKQRQQVQAQRRISGRIGS